MVSPKLSDRINKYAAVFDQELPAKLPVIISLHGRGFARITTLLPKPFSSALSKCFSAALLKVMQEVDGAVFGYSFSDQMVIVVRNDQTHETQPFLGNKIQKIASLTASIATATFNLNATALDLNLLGDGIFYSQVFITPNITEAINVLIGKQQENFKLAVEEACYQELLKKDFNKIEIDNMLANTSVADKLSVLEQSGVVFDDYPTPFRRGVGCFRAPQVVMYEGHEVIKNSLVVKEDLPIFTQDHGFLQGIFKA